MFEKGIKVDDLKFAIRLMIGLSLIIIILFPLKEPMIKIAETSPESAGIIMWACLIIVMLDFTVR